MPSTAVSGVYLADLVDDKTGGMSMIVFVVRDDASHSQILFQIDDATWQAYNDWGGRQQRRLGCQPLHRERPQLRTRVLPTR